MGKVIMQTRLLAFFLFWFFCLVASDLARCENPPPGRDEENTFKAEEKPGNDSQDHDQFFSPLKPRSAGSFLILEQDGKTPSHYEKFMTPSDLPEKKTGR
jgi:hypothetical protein